MEKKSKVSTKKGSKLLRGKKGFAIVLSLLMLIALLPTAALADYSNGGGRRFNRI